MRTAGALCNRVFCDLYWGCHAPTGHGSLAPLCERTLDAVPERAIGNIEVIEHPDYRLY